MKAFYAIFLLVFLASCGTAVNPEPEVNPDTPATEIQQEVSVEIDAEAEKIIEELIKIWEDDDEIWEEENAVKSIVPAPQIEESQDTASAPKVIELETSYTNPAGNVDMNISYSTDSDGKITEISVTSPNYKWMVGFNKNAQAVIGMSVTEASEYYISGSSLTTPAFQEALKNG